MEEVSDNVLVQLTQQIGKGCPGLLEAVFGFLQRRTDFYYEMEPMGKMGFPPGIAEQMVYQHFQKYKDAHHKWFPPDPSIIEKWKKYEEDKKKVITESKV